MKPYPMNTSRHPSPGRQSGVALVMALVIVALAATAAAMLMNQQQFQIRRAGNLFNADQAREYVLGAEAWAMRTLTEDRQNGDTDALDEDWATVLPPIEVPGGYVTGYLVDLQGAFNVNTLVKSGKVDPLALERMQRLLAYMGLDSGIAQALVDWVDPDIEPYGSLGAEDDFYLGLEQPYRAANAPMSSATELRLIRGMTHEVYAQLVWSRVQTEGENDEAATLAPLRPLVSALPEPTAINVNTAPLPVLVSLGLTESQAQQIIEIREEEPFEKVQDFLTQPTLAETDLVKNADQQGDLSVSSNYFLLVGQAEVGRARLPLYSVLYREQTGIMHVVMRSQGTL